MRSEFTPLSLESPSLSSNGHLESSYDNTLISTEDTTSNKLSKCNQLPRQSSSITLHQQFHTTPIFFVDGFMSFEIVDIWTDVIAHFRQRAILNQSPCPPLHRLQSGGVSSAHDAAVSLFYQIKGGREDFGEAHANKHKHDRYGLTHTGFYPEWSGELPIHLLAHSFGGNVVMELQKLLEEQFFLNESGEVYSTDAGWILSVALVSSPLRGTTATYIIGKNPGEMGTIRYFSLGRLFYTATLIWEWIEQHDQRKGFLGVHFRMSHFGLGRDRSLRNLLKNIVSSQLFDAGLDNSSKDLVLEKYLVEPYCAHDQTYYRTYAANMTQSTSSGAVKPKSHWFPGLSELSKMLGNFDIVKDGKGYLDFMLPYESLWRKNDGVCPLISQFHPQDCSQEPCHHINLPDPSKSYNSYFPSKLNPGTWYTSVVPNCSHVDLVPGFNHSFDIPPVAEKVSTWWARLQGIVSPSGPDLQTSSTSSTSTISGYRRIFMDDYLRFLARVDFQHPPTS